MRRWHVLNRFLRDPDTRPRRRFVLRLEELEQREVLAPVITVPSFIPSTEEDTTVVLSGGPIYGTSFSVSDPNEGEPYTAELSATNGVIHVDQELIDEFELTVADNDTSRVTLTGSLNSIDSFLSSGYSFTPTPFYSGDASITLTVNDTFVNDPGSGTMFIKVLPVASPASISFQNFAELRLPSAPFAFPPGFATVTEPWPDLDGSETV